MPEIKVAVIGSGARESVLAEKYALSDDVDRILAFPGNDWIQQRVTDKPVETFPKISTINVPEIVRVCKNQDVTLVDVCQDDAVAAGLVNALRSEGILSVGPTKEAGELEWNKAYARLTGSKLGLYQPQYRCFESTSEASDYLWNAPDRQYWVKAAGLASGKGVIYAASTKEARKAVYDLKKIGEEIVLEEPLTSDDGTPGEEFSAFFINGRYIASAQDYKRESNFDIGRNTGSMGAVSPTSCVTEDIRNQTETYVTKIMTEMANVGRRYDGILYYSGMIVKKNGIIVPALVELNSRWGDPEAQVIVPGILNDFFDLGVSSAADKLQDYEIETDGLVRVAVTIGSRGYPGDFSQVIGKEVFGIDDAMNIDGVFVYGAGMKINEGRYFASGGRLASVVGTATNILDAREVALAGASRISIEGNNVHYRTDIGWRDVDRLRSRKR